MGNTRAIGGIFALTGFIVAVLAGTAGGSDSSGVLTRALIAMVVCFIVGQLSAAAVHRAVVEHTEDYRSGNPIPPVESTPGTTEQNR